MDNEQLVAAIKRCGYTTKDEKDLRYVLFEENLSLIKKFVDPYISLRNNEEDLMQEAFLGLIAAIALLLFAKITESIDKKKKANQ